MHSHAADRTGFAECPVSPDADIAFGIDARFQSRRSERNVVRRIRQYFEGVAQSSHRVHDGFDIVIAVGPFRNDAQADVDLTVRKK